MYVVHLSWSRDCGILKRWGIMMAKSAKGSSKYSNVPSHSTHIKFTAFSLETHCFCGPVTQVSPLRLFQCLAKHNIWAFRPGAISPRGSTFWDLGWFIIGSQKTIQTMSNNHCVCPMVLASSENHNGTWDFSWLCRHVCCSFSFSCHSKGACPYLGLASGLLA